MAIIRIQVYVEDVLGTMRLFDHIEVQRSNQGPPSFLDAVSITSPSAVASTLTGTTQQPYVGLNGTSLKLMINQGTEVTIPFTDPDPVSIQSVIKAITAAVPGLVAVDVENYLRLTTVKTGTSSAIQVTNGTANSVLGFIAGQADTGEDEHIQLMRKVVVYSYSDQGGLPTSYYRTRFINKVSGNVSTWSDWVVGTSTFAVEESHIITGTVSLAGIDGTPLIGAKVTVVNVYSPVIQDGFFIAGRSRTVVTDASGRAQVTLVMGSVLDVVLEGTGVVRRIQVPNAGSTFDLLDPSLQTDDPFGIQTPDLPAAVRSTL
jgi:hypothetical protein